MSVIHIERERPLKTRELLVPIVIGLFFLLFFFRLWYLQVVQSEELRERGRSFQEMVARKDAPRGQIFDRNGKLLAGVRSEIVLTAQPGIVRKSPEIVEKIARFLDIAPSKLQRKIDDAFWRPYLATPIYNDVPIEIAVKIAESGDKYPGFGIEFQPLRYYIDPFSFAHVLGYVSAPNQKDVAKIQDAGFKPQRYVGKMGIESRYEFDLMGKFGEEHMDVDVRRRPLRTHGKDQAIPGEKLVLTLDAGLQKFAAEKLKGFTGAIVALDPSTGEVLCMVSSPAFDASKFIHGISSSDWKSLLEDEKTPMLNRAISARYPPGSAFKIVTTLAAMLKGKFNPHETLHCTGTRRIGDRYFRCLGVHGTVDFKKALAKSCNAYLGELAHRAGVDGMREACKLLKVDQKTEIDLGGESKGIYPSEDCVRRWRKSGAWYIGDTYNFANGQGEVALTPLQMACIVSLVANRGIAYQPHLLKSKSLSPIQKQAGYKKQTILSQINLPDEYWDLFHEAMVEVIQSGSGKRGKVDGIVWAGKTGSADHKKGERSHSWFVGFAPAKQPKIAIAVIAEKFGLGGMLAAPIAGDLVRYYLLPPNKSLPEA